MRAGPIPRETFKILLSRNHKAPVFTGAFTVLNASKSLQNFSLLILLSLLRARSRSARVVIHVVLFYSAVVSSDDAAISENKEAIEEWFTISDKRGQNYRLRLFENSSVWPLKAFDGATRAGYVYCQKLGETLSIADLRELKLC